MKATFKNFQLIADKELYEAMLKKYGAQSYGENKLAIKTNNSFASWMIAEKVGDKYKIVPISSQNNERQSLQMEAYWTTLKEFPIKEFNDVPQFYRQWFVNRGLMTESKMNEVSPSRQKFKIGDKVKIVKGTNKGKKGKIVDTYYNKYGGGQDMKNTFTIYIFSEKQKVSWFTPTQLRPLEENVKEGILMEKRTNDIIQYNLEPDITLYYPRPKEDQVKTFMYTDKKIKNVYKRNGKTIIFPMKDIYGVSKYPGGDKYKSEKVVGKIAEEAERDYKDEYKKFQSSDKSKKYRAELNKYNRDKGTYGNGDGKDATHKNGKISGFEDESTNKGRREKSRLKKESVKMGITKTRLREIIVEEYQKLTEIMIPKDMTDEIKKSISMGFNKIQTGMISPKRKGIMLVNKKDQVRGTYDLKLKNVIQQMIDKPVKEGTVNHPGEIAVYDGDEGLTYISKKGSGYYGYNNNFDFEAKNKKELLDKLRKWRYKLVSGKV